jgi:polyvinyl alcohol dehydrogenase (cytochrome)
LTIFLDLLYEIKNYSYADNFWLIKRIYTMNKNNKSVISKIALFSSLLISTSVLSAGGGTNWLSSGYDEHNTRYNKTETTLGIANVGLLQQKWKLATEGDVSATPAVDGKYVYVPDFAGNLYAVDRETGAIIWQVKISVLTGIPGDHARATPAISGDVLIIGDQAGKVFSPDGYLLGINKKTGKLLWKTQLTGGFPIVTQAAVVHGNTAYIGLASYEEALVRFGFPLTFRGSLLALNTKTGQILWQTYMAPEGYTGNALWGSTPVVDTKRKQIYVATGNNYSVPTEATDCVLAAGTDEERAACLAPSNYFDSVVALDMNTGAINWAFKALPGDAWNLSCGIYFIPGLDFELPGCPEGEGPDYDFGQGPALFTVKDSDGKPRELVGAGQKSGVYWTLDPDTGANVWSTQAASGGIAGGLQWGSAVDGKRVYTANSNSEFKEWILGDGSSAGYRGGWSALDAATGEILWQTPNPAYERGMGPVSAANGVVYACSMDTQGHMFAMNAENGAILWSFASGASCLGGAAIVDGQVFWGTGYDAFSTAPDNNQALYSFGLAN